VVAYWNQNWSRKEENGKNELSSFSEASDGEEYIYLKGWVHPIRMNNTLYVHKYSNKHAEAFQDELLANRSAFLLVCDTETVDRILDIYLPLLGINGIIDVIDAADENMGALLSHYLGAFAYKRASGPLQDLIDITATFKAHGSPLHGAIWSIIDQMRDNSTPKEIFDHIHVLCSSFEEEKGQILENCLHGIGHGLAKRFDFEFLSAIEICEMFTVMDHAYTCASGVFMDVEKQTLEFSWFPCDQTIFPAPCFKFKRLEYNTFDPIESACDTQRGNYHWLACVWGIGSMKSFEFCEAAQWSNDKENQQLAVQYCQDASDTVTKVGASKNAWLLPPNKKAKYCQKYKPSIQQSCMYDNSTRFNTLLLEKYRSSAPSTFLPAEWQGTIKNHTQIHEQDCL